MSQTRLILTFLNLILDYLLVVAAFATAYFVRDELNNAYLVPFEQFFWFALLAAVVYVLIFAYLRLYSVERDRGLVDQLFGVFIGALAATILAGALIYFVKSFDYSRLILGTAMPIAVIWVWLGRALVRGVETWLYRRGIGVTRVLLVGSRDNLEQHVGETPLLSVISGYRTLGGVGYQLAGVITTDTAQQSDAIEGVKTLGSLEPSLNELGRQLQLLGIHELVLADPHLDEAVALGIINLCERTGVRFKFVPDIFDVAIARTVASDLAGLPMIELRTTMLDGWMVVAKRMMDMFLSGLALVALTPVFIFTAVVIKADSVGPVFFRHYRVGRNGREFEVIKFRSMAMMRKDGHIVHASANEEVEKLKEQNSNYKLEGDPRITRVGHFIRKTSIDELPQFWNVLKGDMSLVGPRPYLAKELEKQQETYPQTKSLVQRLLTVRPGLTGPWQVSGRSEIAFTERVAMDAYYATHANIWLDIKILLKTVPVVVKGSGAM